MTLSIKPQLQVRRGRTYRQSMASLLVLIITLSWAVSSLTVATDLPGETSAAAATATATDEDEDEDDYENTSSQEQQQQQQQQRGLLESLWNSFKQTMDMTTTTTTLSTSNSNSDSKSKTSTEQKDTTRAPRGVLSSRRIVLVKQTLQEHYTKQLVDSSPPWLEEYPQQASLTKTSKRTSAKSRNQGESREANRRPLRWKLKTTKGGDCYFFSESAGAYWSFQWCPTGVVGQGFRRKDTTVDIQHFLGYFLPWNIEPPADSTVDDSAFARRFAHDMQTKFPNSAVELYHRGDACTAYKSRSMSHRITVVAIHDDASKYCVGDWTDGLTDLVIESVEEVQVCRYLVHVCRPTARGFATAIDDVGTTVVPDLSTDPMTQSEAVELNQTMHHIHQSMHGYLRQTTADARRKANPDRTTSLHAALPPLPQSRVQSNLVLIRDMFTHAYDSYMYNAFPASEIKPMTCQPASFNLVRIPALTLIDSLDTLVILGNYTEFARAVERLRGLHKYLQGENGVLGSGGGLFALNQNVSVFETNIRVLGGLLSAHQMAEAFLPSTVLEKDVWTTDKANVLDGSSAVADSTVAETTDVCENDEMESPTQAASISEECTEESLLECGSVTDTASEMETETCKNQTLNYWKYDGFLLELAHDMGDRLLPAFSTKTGIPYGTVNLLSGIPQGETPIASLAGGGTLSLEMELLSRLTGNLEYGKAAKLATRALWMRRSKLGLVGKHIDTDSGQWTETVSGIGSNSDSFYEYLIKHHILFPDDEDFMTQMVSTYGGVYNGSRVGEWYGDVDCFRGQSNGGGARRVFEALMAFYPGMQVLLGELTPAAKSLNSFFLIREHLGFLPERFNYAIWRVDSAGGRHYLRPELLESAYFLHRSTKGFQQQFRNASKSNVDSSGWQWAADFALHALETTTKTVCGYASLNDVSPATTGRIGRSQTISEKESHMMNEMPSFFLSETLKYLYLMFDEHNVLHEDQDRDWVFTTEAHPIHHVDVPQQKTQTSQLETLKGRLVDRLRARARGAPYARVSHLSKLKDDKWTSSSPVQAYVIDVFPMASNLAHESATELAASNRVSHGPEFWSTNGMVEPFLSTDQVPIELDFFRETQNKKNVAHLTFSKLGKSLSLTHSCSNFHLPDLKWIRALNGGASDYAEAYVSSAMDKPAPRESSFRMLGSIDALAFYGSGVHVVDVFDETKKCPIVDQQPQSASTPPSDENNSGSNGSASNELDMGGDLGKFEVSAFPGGSGFYIRRIESGETMMTTMIEEQDSDNSINTYLMVHASTPIEWEEDIVGQSSAEEAVDKSDFMERSVVMADFAGNSFKCAVEVVEMFYSETANDADETASFSAENENEEVHAVEHILAAYPCAPAMFGPASMTELKASSGLVVEGSVQTPDGEGYGCIAEPVTLGPKGADTPMLSQDTPSELPEHTHGTPQSSQRDVEGDESCPNRSVHLVHRGICAFQEKSLNQKKAFNADAVIVINSDDDELFVMSGGGADDPQYLDRSNFPPTVLVTGADGKEITEIVDSFKANERSELQIRVSLVRDEAKIVEVNTAFSVHDNKFWPAVRATSEITQIFASGGWGVHALKRSGQNKGGIMEWQLFLMKHEIQESDDAA